MKPIQTRRKPMQAVLALLFVSLFSHASLSAAAAEAVLLVPGISTQLFGDGDSWGAQAAERSASTASTPMLATLRAAGYHYGGIIDAAATAAPAKAQTRANLFVLRFSAAADDDGLGYKGLELAQAISEVRRRSGADRVSLVAYSAGGVVARAYLQGALPGLAYRSDVDRLITISTPHMGAEMATSLGDLLGTRVHSLRPGAPLIQRLNDELPLPADVAFASLVVRGMGADQRGDGRFYYRYLDANELAALPTGLRTGGDQVVHVASQNLALTRAAHRYETASGRPVLYPLVTVDDPSPADSSPFEAKVHQAAPAAPGVIAAVVGLLGSERAWQPLAVSQRLQSYRDVASHSAAELIEQQVLSRHPLSQVTQVSVDELRELGGDSGIDGEVVRFRYRGRAYSRGMILGIVGRESRVEGVLECRFDRFGRIRSVRTVGLRV